MKIAVPIKENNQIDDHFGHCEAYRIFTISDNNSIIEEQTIDGVEGCGCKSDIAGVLAKIDVKIMLAGGIGNGAINVLNKSGIEVVRGCSGSATEAVNSYVKGLITDSGESCQQHEHHHAEGSDHVCQH